jgi:hypothetical protein
LTYPINYPKEHTMRFHLKQLTVVTILTLGLAASGLGGLSVPSAAAQGGQTQPAPSQLTTSTQQSATQVNLDWYCRQPSPAHNSQFCTTYKNNQPHPDYP